MAYKLSHWSQRSKHKNHIFLIDNGSSHEILCYIRWGTDFDKEFIWILMKVVFPKGERLSMSAVAF